MSEMTPEQEAEIEPNGEFANFGQWANKARSWLGGISGGGIRYKKQEEAVCIDTRGRICRNGGDFMRARDEDAFPVKYYIRNRAHALAAAIKEKGEGK